MLHSAQVLWVVIISTTVRRRRDVPTLRPPRRAVAALCSFLNEFNLTEQHYNLKLFETFLSAIINTEQSQQDVNPL